MASLGLEAGRAGAGRALLGVGKGSGLNGPGETPAGRPWREEIRQEEATTGRQRQRKGTEDDSWAQAGELEAGETSRRGGCRPASARDHPLSVSAQPHPRQQT